MSCNKEGRREERRRGVGEKPWWWC